MKIAQGFSQASTFDSAIKYSELAIALAKKIGLKKAQAAALNILAISYWYTDNYPLALARQMDALKIWEETGNKRGRAICYGNIGLINYDRGNYPEALKNYLIALRLNEEMGNKELLGITYTNIG
ncbi:MAG: tetratricopeptide repeat protein, partial [Bacteroidia bacterium]|nr:tetratricopeptide repeat protein [Bacteroidia bacterium]